MADRIKGITIEIGGNVTGLNKALASVNKEIGSTQKQLKDVERLLKLDPGNTTLLAQKQRLLTDEVEQTSEKLAALKDAEKQVQQQFAEGKVSQQQYDALQREIAATEISLQSTQKAAYELQEQMMQAGSARALAELEDAAADLDDAIRKVNEKPIEDVADAADNAEKELEDAADAADETKDSLSGFGDIFTASALVEGISQVVDAVGSLNDEVTEYNRIMASLEVSSENAGYTAEETAASYNKLYSVLGDEQTAATTLSNLQALNLAQGDLNTLIDSAVGAWATYGDSIPIDGLAEAVNETIRTGTVTGNFADVLNWGSKEGETFGVMLKENTEANKEWNDAVLAAESAEDYFNLALQNASSEAERQNLVLQALADQGLTTAGQAWQENNQSIIEANQAQAEFMATASELSTQIAPVLTAVQEGINALFAAILEGTQNVDFTAIAGAISAAFTFLLENGEVITAILLSIGSGLAALKLASFVQQIVSVQQGVTTLAAAFPLLNTAILSLTNPIFLVTTAVVAFVALIATKGEEIKAILQQVDDFLQGVFATDWTNIFGPVLGNALNAFFANVQNIWNSIRQVFTGVIDFIRGVFTGNWQQAWQGVQDIFGGIFNGLVSLAKAPINAIIGLLNGAIGAINTMINGLNSIHVDIPDWIPGIGGNTIGFNIPNIGSIPYLAKGGTVLSGSAIVGEAGPELLTVSPYGTRVLPLTSGEKAAAGKAVKVDNINFYGYSAGEGQQITRAVNRALGRLL